MNHEQLDELERRTSTNTMERGCFHYALHKEDVQDLIAEFCDTGIETTCACRACAEHMDHLDTAAERVRVLIEAMSEKEST